jgi:hypothetical protein
MICCKQSEALTVTGPLLPQRFKIWVILGIRQLDCAELRVDIANFASTVFEGRIVVFSEPTRYELCAIQI